MSSCNRWRPDCADPHSPSAYDCHANGCMHTRTRAHAHRHTRAHTTTSERLRSDRCGVRRFGRWGDSVQEAANMALVLSFVDLQRQFNADGVVREYVFVAHQQLIRSVLRLHPTCRTTDTARGTHTHGRTSHSRHHSSSNQLRTGTRAHGGGGAYPDPVLLRMGI
jgi:hypothetical protein